MRKLLIPAIASLALVLAPLAAIEAAPDDGRGAALMWIGLAGFAGPATDPAGPGRPSLLVATLARVGVGRIDRNSLPGRPTRPIRRADRSGHAAREPGRRDRGRRADGGHPAPLDTRVAPTPARAFDRTVARRRVQARHRSTDFREDPPHT